MKLLIKSAIIIDPGSPHNGKKKDILVSDGIIREIADTIPETADTEVFSASNLHVSPGFFDLQANFRDPGHEYKENLESGAAAALAGGFTTVCVQSSTHPAIDNKSQVDTIRNASATLPVTILPIGALTVGRQGTDMAEMLDMHRSGAVAFSDDKRPIENPKLLELSMEYVKNFNGLVIHFPDTPRLSSGAVMHEGEASVFLGLKGAPAMAEELAINRDLYLLGYTGSRLHFPLISAKNSVELLRNARRDGMAASAAVAPHYLLFNDHAMEEFDSVHKVKPPYRSAEDIEALKIGLKDGTIEVICSDHSPEDIENKNCELEQAAYGIINLETCFAAARTALKDVLSIGQLVEKLAINPRKLTGIAVPSITEGCKAELVVFDPDMQWKFEQADIRSLSSNTPYIGYEFTGKVLKTVC